MVLASVNSNLQQASLKGGGFQQVVRTPGFPLLLGLTATSQHCSAPHQGPCSMCVSSGNYHLHGEKNRSTSCGFISVLFVLLLENGVGGDGGISSLMAGKSDLLVSGEISLNFTSRQ